MRNLDLDVGSDHYLPYAINVLDGWRVGQAKMPLITSPFLLTSLSIYHLVIAYTLLASPSFLASQNIVFVLGSALHLPPISSALPSQSLNPAIAHPAAFSSAFSVGGGKGDAGCALAALFLSYLSLSDMTALALHPEVRNLYWGAQVAVRLSALFMLEAWIYISKPSEGERAQGTFGVLKNDVVFAWAFVETVFMFWTFVTLRGERAALGLDQKLRAEREKEGERDERIAVGKSE